MSRAKPDNNKKADVFYMTDISNSRLYQMSKSETTNLKVDELNLIALAIDLEPVEILSKVCNYLKLNKVK